MRLQDRKVAWTLKVHPILRDWYKSLASSRGTDPQEEARRVLADYRENNKDVQGYTGSFPP